MSAPRIVQVFCKGDAVPGWLIVAEPTSDKSRWSGLVFHCDCCLVEWGDKFILLSSSDDTTIFHFDFAKDVVLSAASKTLVVPTAFQVMYGEGHEGKGRTLRYPDHG